MCKTMDTRETSRFFAIPPADLHDFIEYLITDFGKELSKNNIGTNPDIGWCGERDHPRICFRSRIIVSKSFCSDAYISDYEFS